MVYNQGYHRISLYKDGKQYLCKVARLVAQAFIPNPNNKDIVDHIDGNRSNDCVDNLRWCTVRENMNNPITFPRNRSSLAESWAVRSKTVYQYSMEGYFIKEWANRNQVGKELNIDRMHIGKCCEGSAYSAGGYRWSYEKKDFIGKPHSIYKQIKVAKMDLDGNILSIYNNMKEAADSIGCTTAVISNCIKGWRKTVRGYKFKEVQE